MKTCTFILTAMLGLLAGCQQTSVSTASTGERGFDLLSRNVSQTQGGSVRDSMSLNPPPIRQAPPELVQER
jgi:hypothetical protein